MRSKSQQNQSEVGRDFLMMDMKPRILTIILCFLLVCTSVQAESESRLETAIEAWLADNDEVAIPLLAELARSGDENAMLFLGQLAIRPGRFSPFLTSLGRKKRNALINAGGRFSGVSWFKKVKKDKPLADALTLSYSDQEKLARIGTLLKLGEVGQAIYALHKYEVYSPLFELSKTYKFPEESFHVLWRNAFFHKIYKKQKESLTPYETATIERLINQGRISMNQYQIQGLLFVYEIHNFLSNKQEFKKYSDIGSALMYGELGSVGNQIAFDLLLKAKELKPLANYCAKQCPKNAEKCTIRLYTAIGGYAGLMSMRSPLEKLIPSQRYFDSARYGADLLRRISLNDLKRVRESSGRVNACVKRLFNKSN